MRVTVRIFVILRVAIYFGGPYNEYYNVLAITLKSCYRCFKSIIV